MSSKNNLPKNAEQEEADNTLEKRTSKPGDQSQIKMNFGVQEDANSVTIEEQRLAEVAEAKKQEEQEIKVGEEAEAKKRAEEEERLAEEEEAKKRVHKEIKLGEEAEAKKRAEEEKIPLGKAEAKRETQEKNRVGESTKFRDEEWRKFREVADTKGNTETTDRPKYATDTNGGVEITPKGRTTKLKKKVRLGLLIAILAVVGIWIFSVFNDGTEKQSPVVPKNEATDIEDANVAAEPKTDAANQEVSFSNLEVGDAFDGGIIFTIEPSSKTGKIAYVKDVGPMTWKNAMTIHEQLGEGWRLPTLDELSEMYRSIGQGATNSGQFADELYWSATPYDTYQARLVRFSDGNTSYHYNKNVSHRQFKVRAVRDFSS